MKKELQYQDSRIFHSGCFRVLALAVGLAVCISQVATPAEGRSVSSGPPSDLLALLEIKRAIWADPHGALKNWTIGNRASFCQWKGVNCSSSRVTSLQLRDMGLVGTISPHLGYLSDLITLDLRNNNLTGPIPETLGRCTGLTNIYIDNNKLNGTIPGELGHLTQVQRITLANNYLSGALPHNLCSVSLQELDLRNNNLSGPIPDGFMKNCTSLDALHLEENRLSGLIPDLIDLTNSSLFNDQFTGLFLQGNQLTGPIPSYLHRFSLLRELHLARNNFTGPIPPNINKLTRLFFAFNISHNSVSGTIPPELGTIECLVLLDLSHNNLSGQIPQELGTMKGVTTIDLSYNSLSGSIPTFTQKNLTLNLDGNDKLCGLPVSENCSRTPTSQPSEGRGSHQKSELLKKSLAGASAVLAAFVIVVGVIIRREIRIRKSRVHVVPGGPDSISRGQLFEPGLRQITVAELRAATDNFSSEHLIGKGNSTLVYRAVLENIGWKKSTTEVAVKKLSMGEDFARCRSRLTREIESMKDLQHRNLVRILGYAYNMDVLALILEYMPNGSLERALHGTSNCILTLDSRYKIAVGVARGLVYLHHDREDSVAHLDLKPANILLDAGLEPRIADFGGTRLVCPTLRVDTHTMTCNFTVGYTAPEFVDYARPSTRADVYSFGIVLLELLTRVRPTASIFGESGTITQWMTEAILNKSALTLVDPLLGPAELSADGKEEILTMLHVAVNCTHRDPDRRPDMNIVLDILQNLRSSKRSNPVIPSLEDLLKAEEAIARQDSTLVHQSSC